MCIRDRVNMVRVIKSGLYCSFVPYYIRVGTLCGWVSRRSIVRDADLTLLGKECYIVPR